MTKKFLPIFGAVLGVAFTQGDGQAQVLYSSDLDADDGWTIVGDADSEHQFGFDYSSFGIPSAPNGTGTTGLRMAANIVDPAEAAYISAGAPVSPTGQYRVQVDMWLNYNSSGGTTEFGGGFVGFDSGAGNPRSGAGLLGNTDGDSARDYRLYKDVNEQFIESGQFNPLLGSNNNSDPLFVSWFPGQSTPDAQGVAPFDPTNVIVTAPDGTLGYGWHTLTINVNAGAGTAAFNIDGNLIGTVDSNVGDAVNLEGGVALTFADIFSSVSTKPEFSFGVYDNFVVTQIPEPSALGLLLGSTLLLLRRRR